MTRRDYMKHMIQFKHRFLVALMVLLLPLANIASAATYSSASRAPSRSMKSGFSSQKSQPARSNTYTNNASNQSGNTSFGSFGQQPNKPLNRSDSALNKDLEKNQAQQQALKNMDARTQQKTPMQAAQQTSVTGKPLDTVHANPQPPSPSPMVQAAAAPTIIVQREGSSMGGAFMGFMLGQALSRPHSAPSPSYDTRRNDLEPIDGAADARYSNSHLGDAGNGALAAAKAKPVDTESAGWSMLRFLLWATFLSALSWIAYKIYRLFTPRKQAISHYSLGKV